MLMMIINYISVIFFPQGFPVGSKLGEQERISVPQAEYTKGEFSVCLNNRTNNLNTLASIKPHRRPSRFSVMTF